MVCFIIITLVFGASWNMPLWFLYFSFLKIGRLRINRVHRCQLIVAVDWVIRSTLIKDNKGIRWTLFSNQEDLDYADDQACQSNRSKLKYKITPKNFKMSINTKSLVYQNTTEWKGYQKHRCLGSGSTPPPSTPIYRPRDFIFLFY